MTSKKSRRQAQSMAAAPASQPGVTFSSARSSEREFNPDYTYVYQDLKRIAILAGSFFVILVGLSFFIK